MGWSRARQGGRRARDRLMPVLRFRTFPLLIMQCIPLVLALGLVVFAPRSQSGLAWICALSAVAALSYVAARRAVVSFLFLFILSYILLFLLYPITAGPMGFLLPGDERIGEYGLLTVAGLHLFIVVYDLFSPSSHDLEMPPLSLRVLGRVSFLFLAAFVIALAVILPDRDGLAALTAASRMDLKADVSGLTLLAQYLWVVGCVGLVLAPIYLRRAPALWVPFILFLILVGVIGFLAFRTRSVLLFLGSSVAVGMWLRTRVPVQARGGEESVFRRVRSPALALILTAAVIVVIGGSYLRFARGLFEESGVAGFSQVDLAEALRRNLEWGDLGYSQTVFDLLAYVPETTPHLGGQSYYRLLFIPIPRQVWSGKPVNTERIVAGWLTPGIANQTIPPGIQGDLYINFGLAGVLGFVLFGWVFARLDRLPGLWRVVAIGIAPVPVFHLVRGGFTNPVLLLGVALGASYMAHFLLFRRSRRASRSRSTLLPSSMLSVGSS